MLDLPIIPVGLRPNLSRTDRIEPQRVEPAFAISVPLCTRGVEGATLEPHRSRSVRTQFFRFGSCPSRARRGLRNRLQARLPRPSRGVSSSRGLLSPAGESPRSDGSGRTLLPRSSRWHPARSRTSARGSGPRARRYSRHAPRLGDEGRRATARRFALGFSSVRFAVRGGLRRAGPAPVPGGSGL